MAKIAKGIVAEQDHGIATQLLAKNVGYRTRATIPVRQSQSAYRSHPMAASWLAEKTDCLMRLYERRRPNQVTRLRFVFFLSLDKLTVERIYDRTNTIQRARTSMTSGLPLSVLSALSSLILLAPRSNGVDERVGVPTPDLCAIHTLAFTAPIFIYILLVRLTHSGKGVIVNLLSYTTVRCIRM